MLRHALVDLPIQVASFSPDLPDFNNSGKPERAQRVAAHRAELRADRLAGALFGLVLERALPGRGGVSRYPAAMCSSSPAT